MHDQPIWGPSARQQAAEEIAALKARIARVKALIEDRTLTRSKCVAAIREVLK